MAAILAAPGVAVAACACPAIYVGDIPGIDPTIPPRVNPVCLALVTPGNINPVTGNPITIPTSATAVRKSVTRADNADGTATFSVTLTGAIPTATNSIDVLDCVWIDVNGNGTFDQGESVRAYEASAAVVAGTGANRTIDFKLTVPNAAGRSVCNRAVGVNFAGLTGTITNQAGIEAGTWIQAQSNIVCSDFGVPAVVPEAPAAASLLASALGGIGVGWFFMRRRRRLAVVPLTAK